MSCQNKGKDHCYGILYRLLTVQAEIELENFRLGPIVRTANLKVAKRKTARLDCSVQEDVPRVKGVYIL